MERPISYQDKSALSEPTDHLTDQSLTSNEADDSFAESEQTQSSKETMVKVALLFFFALNASLIALDLWSHPDQGVANLERRKFLVETFSPFFKHIGNYAISAILVIVAGLCKQFLDAVTTHKVTKAMIKKGYMWAVAGTLTLNGLIETFAGNNEPFKDFTVGGWAVFNSVVMLELLAISIALKKAHPKKCSRKRSKL